MIPVTKAQKYSVQKMEKSRGVIVTSKVRESILDFNPELLFSIVKSQGALILRNFQANLADFSNFIKKHSAKVTCDPARKSSVENAQLIDAGTDAMGLHIENGNLPFLPDVQWFFCEVPAANDSQTTLCDGVEVWNRLSNQTKELFLRKRIKYTRNIRNDLWRKYFSVEFDVPIERISETHLDVVNRCLESQKYTLKNDGSVFSEYKVSAVRKNAYNKKYAFANSLLGPSFNYEQPKITFEDDTVIPDALVREVQNVTNHLIIDINWKQGDVVVLDNTSYMHGRRELKDINRKIYGGQSYIN